jgi:hypothetical protein
MSYRRAAIPAVAGGLLITVLLWWAGASAHALLLPGSDDVLGGAGVMDLARWLFPWSYDSLSGAGAYADLHHTAMQIRFAAVFVFFTLGALLLLRRLPTGRGRTAAVLGAVWAWGLVAGMLSVAVSSPWLVASRGHGSFRFLPNLASVIASGHQILLPAALLTAGGTVLVARLVTEDAEHSSHRPVPEGPARLAAWLGTAVVALSLLVLSYTPVAAALQTSFTGRGMYSAPGDLIRQWLLLGGWAGPTGAQPGRWLLYRLPDVLLLVLVWWALRLLPRLLTRVTVPAMALGTVCATVLALLVSQLLRVVLYMASPHPDTRYLLDRITAHLPAAFTVGLLAGVAAAVTLRLAGGAAPAEAEMRSGPAEA